MIVLPRVYSVFYHASKKCYMLRYNVFCSATNSAWFKKNCKKWERFSRKKSISYFHHYGGATLDTERSLVNNFTNCKFTKQEYKFILLTNL